MTANLNRKPVEEEDQVNVVPKERRCLMCGTEFVSHSFGERICKHCKSSSSWRAGF